MSEAVSLPDSLCCPVCLRILPIEDLRWRCPSTCPHDSPSENPVFANAALTCDVLEQSQACRQSDCTEILQETHAKKCDYFLQGSLGWPRDRQLHTVILGSDRDAARQTAIALHYALRLDNDANSLITHPLNPHDYRLWHKPELQVAVQSLPAFAPLGMEVYPAAFASAGPRPPWAYSLYFHTFPKPKRQNWFDDVKIDGCRSKRKHAFDQWLAQADYLVLALRTADVFAAEESRQHIDNNIKALTKLLKIHNRLKHIFIAVFDKRDFFQHLCLPVASPSSSGGEAHTENFMPAPDDNRLIEEYLLYSARLKPLLQNLLDSGYILGYGLFDRDFSRVSATAYLTAWTAWIRERCI